MRVLTKALFYPVSVLILLLGHPHPAAAQRTPAEKADPGLSEILAMPDDTSKIRAYLRYADTSAALANHESLLVSTASQMVVLAKKLDDSEHLIKLYDDLFHYYYFAKNDFNTGFDYNISAYQLAKSKGYRPQTVHALGHLAQCYIYIGDYEKALSAYHEALAVIKLMSGTYKFKVEAWTTRAIGQLYREHLKRYDKALDYGLKAIQMASTLHDTAGLAYGYDQAALDYYHLGHYTTAYRFCEKALNFKGAESDVQLFNSLYNTLGTIYRDAPDEVLSQIGIRPAKRLEKMSEAFTKALWFAKQDRYLPGMVRTLGNLSDFYARKEDYREAYKTHLQYIALRDSAENAAAIKTVLQKQMRSEFSRQADSLQFAQKLTDAQLHTKQVQSYYFIGGLFVLAALSVFIWRNYNTQRRSNALLLTANAQISSANNQLSEQQAEITKQRDQLTETVTNLTNTQRQLIQAEKMASLGELTAGIAHEIQNPLNFVNNFAEVSLEMIGEANDEILKGDTNEASAILNDVQQNVEKIHHHGKRADLIVKNMLEHSRVSTGQREPTDINKLAGEYLKLAYHGMRAKDKSFQAELVTTFEEGLPSLPLNPQDIGRVLLNLCNNAFYAVRQKQQITTAGYEPLVSISTKRDGDRIVIMVTDNGAGIPEAVRDKIMQPFFTTKPTGQGTGLGLSLSYDIIVKAHHGQLFLNTGVTEGTEMIITLPLISK